MEELGIIFIIGVFFFMWWMARGQEWLEKRRFKKLPQEEQQRILKERSQAVIEEALDNLRKHEEFMKNQIKTPSDHYAHKGAMNDIKNNFDQALRDYETAIKLDPQNDQAYYGRAFVFHQLRNYQRETQDLVMAAKLGNRNAKDYLSKKKINWEEANKIQQKEILTGEVGDLIACPQCGTKNWVPIHAPSVTPKCANCKTDLQ